LSVRERPAAALYEVEAARDPRRFAEIEQGGPLQLVPEVGLPLKLYMNINIYKHK
jgi:hypothetical protein